MLQDQADVLQSELNDLLEAYERARVVEGDVDLRVCLPRDTHPLYFEARRELVRLDMEYSWQNRCPKRLAVYVALFPDLLDDEQSAQDIAFEEFRLRVLAGESPSAAEYARLYRVNVSQWPGSDTDLSAYPKTVVAASARVHDDNDDTTVNRIHTPPLEWDMLDGAASIDEWGLPSESLSGQTAKALLQQTGTHSNAEVSFLLAQALTSLPEVGAQFLNFQLIAELGRGGFGRVYLARQSGLANRLVALKLTVDLQGEEQKLAQLQHTNVVPVYSAHKTSRMHAVCMPFFGSTTLADAIRRIREKSALPTTGACFVETLRARMTEFLAQSGTRPHGKAGDSGLPSAPAPPAALKMLEESSYVNAVLWLTERVTEGLMHAHEHGILHGDLKPANILLTDEGQPMLLDFNLATDIKVRAALGELRVGGTLPYMAPEHLSALKGGDKQHVDARSDLYGLGVILFELLTGRQPFETKRGPLADTLPSMIAERLAAPPRLRAHNSAISPAVESIVHHCLEPDPSKRYQTAQELHEDLQLHAQDLPLRHAPEPSLAERASKWMRRHPYVAAPTNIVAVCLVILAAILTPGAWQAWQDWQADRQNLVEAQTAADLAKKNTEDVHKKLLSADERARGAEARIKALNRFREVHAAAGVARDLVDGVTLVRLRPEAWAIEQANLAKLAARCHDLLKKYNVTDELEWQMNANVAALPIAELEMLRADVASLLYALAEAEHLYANRFLKERGVAGTAAVEQVGFAGNVADALVQSRIALALTWNAQARQCLPPNALPRAFLIQQSNLARLAGDDQEANVLEARADETHERGEVDDRYWTAAALAAQAKLKDAGMLIADVTRQVPDHFGAWRLRALCHQSAGEFRKAESCWDTCAALKPEDQWVRYCRGQVSLHLSKWLEAQQDFDAFVKKHPSFRDAYVQRAAAWEGQRVFKAAIDDLTMAIDLGPPAPELLFFRVELMEKNKDKDGAQQDRIRLLSSEPSQIDGWIYRGMIQAKSDPKAALADLERALAVEPNNVVALYQKSLLLADRLSRPKEAIGALNRLLIAEPNHADARLKRGLLYAKMGIPNEAGKDAERALERDVTPARCYQAACIYAFTSQEVPGDRKRVIELLDFALRNGYANDQVKNDVNLPLAHIPEATELIRAAPFLGPALPPTKAKQ